MKKLLLSNREITTENDAFIMGIVNATPDSFWKGSRGGVDIAKKHILEGADIIDIGGESTRPGAEYISEKDEIDRVIPIIRDIRKFSSIPISIDTRKKVVLEAALQEGADILNDVSALEDDSEIASFCASKNIPVILMHKRGIPSVMQNNTIYENIFLDVNTYLEDRVKYALFSGIKKDKIILDVGIGFGKDLKANITLIKNCGKICNGEYPILMALSRKTCIGQMTGKDIDERLYGTIAANIVAIEKGASIIRVHDVLPASDTLKVMKFLNKVEN